MASLSGQDDPNRKAPSDPELKAGRLPHRHLPETSQETELGNGPTRQAYQLKLQDARASQIVACEVPVGSPAANLLLPLHGSRCRHQIGRASCSAIVMD